MENPPTGQWFLDTEPEKGKEALRQNNHGNSQGHIDDNRPEDIGNDVPQDDLPGGDPDCVSRLDEFLFLDRQGLPPDNPGHGQPFHRTQGNKDEENVAAEKIP